ncbi:MAG: glycosyltransferase family 4 protein [Candidatus Omnitrophica bacterium]|nr:glycosyltransferase family 4 protein [Candidatus Omnitrophota bacterium]
MLMGKTICVSNGIREKFLKKRRSDFITKPSRDKVIMIHDAVDLDEFIVEGGIADMRSELGTAGNITLGIIAAIHENKNQELFLDIAKEIKIKVKNSKFLIVGDTYGQSDYEASYKQKLIDLVEKFNLKNDVIFTGYRKDIPDVLKAIDIFVLTSLYEAFGLVIVEAMASGKPVVSSACDGPLDIIENGKTGFLITSYYPEDFVSKIMLLMENDELRKRMGEAGRNRIEAMFGIKHQAQKITELYVYLLN